MFKSGGDATLIPVQISWRLAILGQDQPVVPLYSQVELPAALLFEMSLTQLPLLNFSSWKQDISGQRKGEREMDEKDDSLCSQR
jgi:hypothetical protein